MFDKYLPKKFCREFALLKGHSVQITMIMAVVLGIKPCMDDWIPLDRLHDYKRICKKYGLYIYSDAIFSVVEKKEIPHSVIGRDRLTTTMAFGYAYSPDTVHNGSVHVFVSRTKKHLDEALKDGWYPLIIHGRVIDKPLIDAHRFGSSLGYPDCCIDFFRKYNNWYRYSFLYESFKNTRKGTSNFLCNPFNKNTPYTYIYHMPCSYACKNTICLTKDLRLAIKNEEPEFVKIIDAHLRLPFLVFYERKYYCFDGVLRKGRIYYQGVYFPDFTRGNNLYLDTLKRGNCVFIDNNDVVVLRNRTVRARIKVAKNAFAPEQPFLIQFS